MQEHLSLNVAITAPTGVATWLIDGTTVHYAFGLDHELESSIEGSSILEKQLAEMDVFIIDECSMLTKTLFHKVQDLCHYVSRNHNRTKPFGGKHVILLGDPAQLPPVGATIFNTSLWTRYFQILLLKDVVRQTNK